jgi:hypothetical protein
MKKTHFDEHLWIDEDEKKVSHGKNHGRQSVPLPPTDQRRNTQNNRQHRTFVFPLFNKRLSLPVKIYSRRSPSNSHRNRALSVSGRLRCSRCQDALGKTNDVRY